MTEASRKRELADLWTWFADQSCRNYSPLYDRVCRQVAASDEVLDLVLESPEQAHLPNVLLAAVHYLVLGGLDHRLSGVYSGESDEDPGPLFVDVCLANRGAISELLATRHTNTNEVGRSAVLGPALTEVARRLGDPLSLVDVGCSAGLNLLCDRYLLDYGETGSTGPIDAAIRLPCDVIAGSPPVAPFLPPIAARFGLDRDPVDLGNEDAVRWQLACVWPDTGRLARTRLAIEEARAFHIDVTRGDAVDDLPEVVNRVPEQSVPVIITTWALAYLPWERRSAFEKALAEIGRHRPVAWISGEGAGVVPALSDIEPTTDADGTKASVLGLVSFGTNGPEATLLGFVHPHGSWIDWRALPTGGAPLSGYLGR